MPADPKLPAEIGGAGPQAGGDSAYHPAEREADAATNASPAKGDTTEGTDTPPSREGIEGTGWKLPFPTHTDTY